MTLWPPWPTNWIWGSFLAWTNYLLWGRPAWVFWVAFGCSALAAILAFPSANPQARGNDDG